MESENTLVIPERTLAYIVRETISNLQEGGLLLTKEEIDEYRKLKREAEDEKLLGVEAARLMGVSSGTITSWRICNLIKGYRDGKRWKYSKTELLELKQRTTDLNQKIA